MFFKKKMLIYKFIFQNSVQVLLLETIIFLW